MHIKQSYGPEPYITFHLSRSQRVLVAWLRAGIPPLAVEVGGFKNIQGKNSLKSLEKKARCII